MLRVPSVVVGFPYIWCPWSVESGLRIRAEAHSVLDQIEGFGTLSVVGVGAPLAPRPPVLPVSHIHLRTVSV